eukprot:5659501-Amphidinium_carterae.1
MAWTWRASSAGAKSLCDDLARREFVNKYHVAEVLGLIEDGGDLLVLVPDDDSDSAVSADTVELVRLCLCDVLLDVLDVTGEAEVVLDVEKLVDDDMDQPLAGLVKLVTEVRNDLLEPLDLRDDVVE